MTDPTMLKTKISAMVQAQRALGKSLRFLSVTLYFLKPMFDGRRLLSYLGSFISAMKLGSVI